MLTRTTILTRWLAAAAAAASLSACGGGQDDLRAYIDEVKARPGGRIEPLPQVKPAPTFLYVPGNRRSPFMPDTPQQRVSSDPNAIEGPDPNRPREFLEQFPLDTLTMVGTLASPSRNANFGLVQTADGLIHRVAVGNHMGQNYGRIMAITDSEIQLVEIISDGLGGFIERPAAVALSD
ncbi:MAG TPA: pilus assembly protein PilP [Gammaproteobacteria bacterium]|nr:pilus assembly protein PilP [Gammaproteobacteria bacterium]